MRSAQDTSGLRHLVRYGAMAATVVLVAGAVPPHTWADTPYHPITIELGPGNDDVALALKEYVAIPRHDGATPSVPRQPPDLSGRDLRRAEIHLELGELRGVNLDRANLTGADIDETHFVNCSFRNAILRSLRSCGDIGQSCDVTDADISGSNLHLTGAQLCSTKNYKRRDLSGIHLCGDFRGISFAGFNLRGTSFHLCDLEGCDFRDADITQAGFCCARAPVDGFGTSKGV